MLMEERTELQSGEDKEEGYWQERVDIMMMSVIGMLDKGRRRE